MAATAGPRAKRYGRWRAATLTLVYVIMGVHIAHWKASGKTLAPLELNEVMYTLELGIITAGFVFICLAFLSSAVFGRFFCSWGCHILALEDLCAWILRRLHIRTKPVRSRMLLLVPPAAMFYMFLWPQVSRILSGQPLPEPRILTDEQGWASFVTTDFWRNLPGPWIIFLTFGLCGFAIVYLLGSRSFCRYGCPYGVLFGLADRLSPGRIKETGTCAQCGHCTAVCTSHVQVHREIKEHGMVVDPQCLKDLDCVSACPQGAIHFAFTRPALGRSFRPGRRSLRYDFSWREEILMAGAFLACLAVFRGLYRAVPFLMTLALAAIAAWLAVVSVRLLRRRDVRLAPIQLKRAGRLRPAGAAFAALGVAWTLFFGHSAFIRWHEMAGDRAWSAVEARLADAQTVDAALLADALGHHRIRERWGLVRPGDLDSRMAFLLLRADPPAAGPYLRRLLRERPDDAGLRLALARVSMEQGDLDTALARARTLAAPAVQAEVRAGALALLGEIHSRRGETAEAVAAWRESLFLLPDQPGNHRRLAALLRQQGEEQDAAEHERLARILERQQPGTGR